MVESIYFLKPAWCGTHFAGLWPEQGLQPVTRATALRRWFVTQQACHHQGHHLAFATAKRSVTVPQCSHLGRLTKCSFAAFDGLPDRAQQRVIAKRLRKELDRSRLHRLDRLRNIAVARNE